MSADEFVPCGASTPNPLGNRRGTCICVLPQGHEGDHECQSANPHHWSPASVAASRPMEDEA